MPKQPPIIPKGPPPYPVTYKEFFITDPKTGKQTMKIQMYPAKNESEFDEEGNQIDENEVDADWQYFYDHYASGRYMMSEIPHDV